MMKPPRPHNERRRLEVLRSLKLLDTDPEERFDRVTRLARRVFDAPIALVTLIDADRQWFKSKQGLDVCETGRDISFCGHAILDDPILVVEDSLADERFADNPLVTGKPHIRFYAGYPLTGPGGMKVGTLCVIDRKARTFSPEDHGLLVELGRMVEQEMLALSQNTVDALTGISNLQGFEMLAAQTLAVCQRLQRPAALVYLNIEGFGRINERFGPDTGDATLVEIAHLMLALFRDSDVLGRLGPDDFGVLLTATDHAGAQVAVERLQRMLGERNRALGLEEALDFHTVIVNYMPARHASVGALISAAAALASQQNDGARRRA